MTWWDALEGFSLGIAITGAWAHNLPVVIISMLAAGAGHTMARNG